MLALQSLPGIPPLTKQFSKESGAQKTLGQLLLARSCPETLNIISVDHQWHDQSTWHWGPPEAQTGIPSTPSTPLPLQSRACGGFAHCCVYKCWHAELGFSMKAKLALSCACSKQQGIGFESLKSRKISLEIQRSFRSLGLCPSSMQMPGWSHWVHSENPCKVLFGHP